MARLLLANRVAADYNASAATYDFFPKNNRPIMGFNLGLVVHAATTDAVITITAAPITQMGTTAAPATPLAATNYTMSAALASTAATTGFKYVTYPTATTTFGFPVTCDGIRVTATASGTSGAVTYSIILQTWMEDIG